MPTQHTLVHGIMCPVTLLHPNPPSIALLLRECRDWGKKFNTKERRKAKKQNTKLGHACCFLQLLILFRFIFLLKIYEPFVFYFYFKLARLLPASPTAEFSRLPRQTFCGWQDRTSYHKGLEWWCCRELGGEKMYGGWGVKESKKYSRLAVLLESVGK